MASWLLKSIEEYNELPTERIALQLSRLNRYAGAIEWSVLDHSLLVWELVKNESATCQAWGLLHDAAECWIGDALLPAKQVAGLAWSDLEHLYDCHIQRLTGLNPDRHERTCVANADKWAVKLELLFTHDMQHPDRTVRAIHAMTPEIKRHHWKSLVQGLLGVVQSVSEVGT